MKVQFSVPKGCSCRSFMKEIFPQVNAFRKTLGKRRISMSMFYTLRRNAAEEWLDDRIARRYAHWFKLHWLARHSTDT